VTKHGYVTVDALPQMVDLKISRPG